MVAMSPCVGEKKQKRIRQIADGFEQPEQDDKGNRSRQDGCETGPEVRLPTGEKSVLHRGNLGGFGPGLKREWRGWRGRSGLGETAYKIRNKLEYSNSKRKVNDRGG